MLEQAEYYDAVGSGELCNRFVASCQTGFERLTAFPESGARVRLSYPALQDCRFILTPDFEKAMIFYKLSNDKLQIVRVLHGARDIEAVLNEGESHETQH